MLITMLPFSLRNSEFVRIKNMPCGVFLRCMPAFILGMITDFIYFSIKHGKFRIYCSAQRDALAMLPVLLKKRNALMHGKAVPDNYLIKIMSSVFFCP